MPRQDRLACEERGEHRRQHQQEHNDGEDNGLRPEHGQPFRNGGEARADHSGRVLAGDHEHAEDGDRELRDVDAGEGDVEGVAIGLFMGAH